MNVLIFNCGSSSQSFKVYGLAGEPPRRVIGSGKAKNIATKTQAEPRVEWTVEGDRGGERVDPPSHRRAAEEALRVLRDHGVQIDAIGHRFVHGGEWFDQTTRLNADTAEDLRKCFSLAPIHNPNSYSVFEVCLELLPAVPQFAVFDTSFHANMPEEAKRYALPRELATAYGFRKYGFHGLSYTYVSARAALLLDKPLDSVKLIMCHLGTGGSSVAAFKEGRSVDTSMGYSPLPGLVMSTRCGDIDAGNCARNASTRDERGRDNQHSQ